MNNVDFKSLIGSEIINIREFIGYTCIEFKNNNKRVFLIIESAFRIKYDDEIVLTCQDFCYNSIAKIIARCIQLMKDLKVTSCEINEYNDLLIRFGSLGDLEIFNNINVKSYDTFLWKYYELDDVPIYSVSANINEK